MRKFPTITIFSMLLAGTLSLGLPEPVRAAGEIRSADETLRALQSNSAGKRTLKRRGIRQDSRGQVREISKALAPLDLNA